MDALIWPNLHFFYSENGTGVRQESHNISKLVILNSEVNIWSNYLL